MNFVVRRRLAAGVVATAAALTAGLLVQPHAGAAASDTISVAPGSTSNVETKTITITLGSNANNPLGYPPGSTVKFTRTGTTDAFSQTVDPTGDPTAPTVTVNFADVGSGVGGDGPANSGTYDVSITTPGSGALATDGCTACFDVSAPPTTSATSVTPNAIAQGGSNNITVNGTGFSRGSTVTVQLPDGSGPDTAITTNGAPTDSSGTAITNGITTPTKITRRWTVGATTPTGPRDVVVHNPEGSTATCSQCFIVNGAPMTGVSPGAASNDPNAAPVRLTFTGTGLNSGTPSLQFVGDPGSSTKTDLAITGTNPSYTGTSASADFDLRNAAPGDRVYEPTLTQADGSQNGCTCKFSVTQPTQPVVKTVSPNTQKQGTTQTVHVTGTNFSKGVKIVVSGTGVTTTSVTFIDPSNVDATFSATAAAATGARDVSAQSTDTTATPAAACKGCYTITSNASPSASSTASGTACPTASSSPSSTATASSTASPTASSTASPTASATASSTASPTASATASSTTSPTASAPASSTASATGSPTSSTNGCETLTISVNPRDIVPTQASTVTVHGSPNQPVQVYAYSRPNTTYGLVRSGTTNSAGNISWTVTPGGNTRLYAHYTSGSTTTASNDSLTTVIEVHTSLSLSAYRDGVRKYHFQGTNLPRRAGQLITLYRYATGPNLDQYCVPTAESDTTAKDDGSCHAIITSQAKTGPNNTWRIDRTFTGNGQFYFVVRTSKNLNNGRGHSNQRLTVIH